MTQNEAIEILLIYKERLKNEYEKPGWNKWALFGALSSLIWLMLEAIKKNEFEYKNAILIAFAIFVSENLINQVSGEFHKREIGNQDKYINLNKYSPSIYIPALFDIFIVTILLYIVKYNSNSPYNIIIYFYLIKRIITYIIVLLFINTKAPFPFTLTKNKIIKSISKILFYISLIITISTISIILSQINNWTSPNIYQSSFLLFGIYYTTNKLIETLEKKVDINEIDKIVDQVNFKKLQPEKAIGKLNKLINGEKIADVAKYFQSKLIGIYNKQSFELSKIENQINLTNWEESNISNENNLNQAIQKFNNKTLKEINKSKFGFNIYFNLIKEYVNKNNEINEIIKQKENLETKIILKTEQLNQKIETFKEIIKIKY